MIRMYRNEDAEALVSIWQSASALAHPFLTDEFVAQEAINIRTLYLPNAETWVMERDDVIIGFIALVGDEIGGLFLDPSFHGQGLGSAMVDHAVNIHGPLRVEVFERNSIGRRFYERYGFTEVGRYRHDPSDEITLQLTMPTP